MPQYSQCYAYCRTNANSSSLSADFSRKQLLLFDFTRQHSVFSPSYIHDIISILSWSCQPLSVGDVYFGDPHNLVCPPPLELTPLWPLRRPRLTSSDHIHRLSVRQVWKNTQADTACWFNGGPTWNNVEMHLKTTVTCLFWIFFNRTFFISSIRLNCTYTGT